MKKERIKNDVPLTDDYFHLKESTIPHAGQGLFATRFISKNTRLLEYKGKKFMDGTCPDKQHRYCFAFSKFCINSQKIENGNLSRYVNDSRNSKFSNNCRWAISYLTKKVFIVSTQDINQNDELFIDYGEDYW